MFDLVGMIHRATDRAGHGPLALAAPYDLSDYHCRSLVEAGIIDGYILAGTPRRSDGSPAICGWWVDRAAGRWFLRDTVPETVLLVGARPGELLSGQMLLEAHLKGVRRVLLADVTGSILREVEPTAELIGHLGRTGGNPRCGETSYEAVFDLVYEVLGDRFRLPPDAFVPNRVTLMLGHLGAGGAERQTVNTAIGLARHGYEVVIACSYLDPPSNFFLPVVEQAGIEVRLTPSRTAEYHAEDMWEARNRMAAFDNLGARNILEVIFHYALLLHSLRPALLHTWMDYCNVLGGIAADLVGVPHLVVSGRNVAPDNFPALYQPYMKPGYSLLLAGRSALFLNNSANGARDYARWLDIPESAFRVVHNGFKFPESAPAGAREIVRNRYGIPQDAFVVGTIARFAEEKNPRLFVDAARLLHHDYPEMRFLAFGAGPLLDETRSYVASLGLSQVIDLPGTTDAWQALAAMDLFMLTSRMEGLPNVLIEAQAAGVPVVCTAVGGSPETLDQGRTGFAVHSQTPGALGDAVARLYKDVDLRNRMSEQACRFIRANFSVERMVSATIEAYEHVIAARSSHSRDDSYSLAAQMP